jgi:hypothetical protein
MNSTPDFSFLKRTAASICVVYENLKRPTEDDVRSHKAHGLAKIQARDEKKRGKDATSIDAFSSVLSFDMENVFNLPIGNASSFFYNRKFRIFILTGIFDFILSKCSYICSDHFEKKILLVAKKNI